MKKALNNLLLCSLALTGLLQAKTVYYQKEIASVKPLLLGDEVQAHFIVSREERDEQTMLGTEQLAALVSPAQAGRIRKVMIPHELMRELYYLAAGETKELPFKFMYIYLRREESSREPEYPVYLSGKARFTKVSQVSPAVKASTYHVDPPFFVSAVEIP